MINATLSGPRIGELLLAEFVGRATGPLASFGVEDVADPATLACAAGETYVLRRDGEAVADVAIEPTCVLIDLRAADTLMRIETGAAVKNALDDVVRRLA